LYGWLQLVLTRAEPKFCVCSSSQPIWGHLMCLRQKVAGRSECLWQLLAQLACGMCNYYLACLRAGALCSICCGCFHGFCHQPGIMSSMIVLAQQQQMVCCRHAKQAVLSAVVSSCCAAKGCSCQQCSALELWCSTVVFQICWTILSTLDNNRRQLAIIMTTGSNISGSKQTQLLLAPFCRSPLMFGSSLSF
jgi:hypothetical protein